VRPYLSILAMRFKTSIQYRSAAVAGYVTQMFFGIVMVSVLGAFYASGRNGTAVPLQSFVNYIWLGQAFLGMLPWTVDRDVQAMIRSGNVVFEFLRPLDLYLIWFAHSLAWRVSSTILRAVPLVLTVALVFPLIGPVMAPLTGPASVEAGLAFVITYGLTILLSVSITVFMNVLTLLFLSADGLNVFMMALVTVFSGMVIPLPLFPDALQTFFLLQPFASLVDIPFRYYAGVFPVSRLAFTLPLQAFWIACFVLAGRLMLRRVRRKLGVQGG
jgi:ABC-2 type transport system permease protein